MTIALTLERYQAITSPVQYRARGNDNITGRFLTYVIPVLVVTLFYYTPKFFDLEVVERTYCNTGDQHNNFSKIKNISEPIIGERDTFNCTQEYEILPSSLRTNHRE